MRPAPFELIRPTTLSEAMQARAAGAVPLAGGQTLLQNLRLGQSRPSTLVDILQLDCLTDTIECHNANIEIGAKVSHRQLAVDPMLEKHCPWLCEAAKLIGDVQVRNLGTTLGNVCWGDPRANMAIALLASDAQIEIARNTTAPTREYLPLSELFLGFRQTDLERCLALKLSVPIDPPGRGIYLEFSRQPQDLALVNVCIVQRPNGVRIALGGIAPIPRRCPVLENQTEDFSSGADIAELLLQDERNQPPEDSFGSRAYKMQVAGELVFRALRMLEE